MSQNPRVDNEALLVGSQAKTGPNDCPLIMVEMDTQCNVMYMIVVKQGKEGRRGKTTGSGGNGEGRQRHGMR